MRMQSGQWRLLDSTETAALSLPDQSMSVTPTVGKPDADESQAHAVSASEHLSGLNDSTEEDENARLPTDPPKTTEE